MYFFTVCKIYIIFLNDERIKKKRIKSKNSLACTVYFPRYSLSLFSFSDSKFYRKIGIKNFTSRPIFLFFYKNSYFVTFRPTHHPNNKNIEKRSNLDSISRFQFEALPSVYIFLVGSGHEAGRMA